MPLLIAEVGGSSSRWAFLDSGSGATFLPLAGDRLPGFNPLSGDAALFAGGLREYLNARLPVASGADDLQVYGAGCGTPERAAIMESALRQLWPSAAIHVHTDLFGAARGLWQRESGLALVIGTGSSVGWYDGERLHQSMPSLGYVLGDEGSGADIGRVLLQDAFYHRMPEDARLALFGTDGLRLQDVLQEVYRSPFPSRALAAYAGRLAGMTELDYVRELVTARFHALIEAFKPFHGPEQRASVRATGSIAWGFREILSACLLEHGMDLVGVERDPLKGLVRWHQQPVG